MGYSSPSDVRYINELSDIPLTGPDPWDETDKLKAVEAAESLLEARANDGEPITAAEAVHRTAVNAYATYILLTGTEHPNSAQSGDFYNGSGEDQAEVASEMKNIWTDAVEALIAAEDDESEGMPELSVPSIK